MIKLLKSIVLLLMSSMMRVRKSVGAKAVSENDCPGLELVNCQNRSYFSLKRPCSKYFLQDFNP